MTPDQARAAYRREIKRVGELVTVRRVTGGGEIAAQTWARVMGYRPDELVGGITQGSRKIILLPDGLETAGWPIPIVRGDEVVVRGKTLIVDLVDDSTRRIAGELIAYELTAKGS